MTRHNTFIAKTSDWQDSWDWPFDESDVAVANAVTDSNWTGAEQCHDSLHQRVQLSLICKHHFIASNILL